MHDESTLPKWAQDRLSELRSKLQGMEAAHRVLTNRDWYVISEHSPARFTLWRLAEDKPVAICTVGEGCVMLVGNERKGGK